MARPIKDLDLSAAVGWFNYETDVGPDHEGFLHPDYDLQADWSYSASAQYRINFKNGAMLIPRIDMYYQGERTIGEFDRVPIPGNEVSDYTIFNARLTYVSPDTHWSISLEAQNLFDKFYWTGHDPLFEYDGDTDDVIDSYGLTGLRGQPGRPRQIGLTLRYNFF